ncbi:hypothetical protein M501DRAFT_1015830 [Patellaria atrata CBS 101060]|uniref:Uncharacterized protein n=1 Tax=Patellaria atrata CBS 101060 TaxID=1346257 RepID=A0A9P4SDC5_9PEZI|nr:hypothetical protein M501DRAFT_1015830 [Patellaria atrata CBS 101060]
MLSKHIFQVVAVATLLGLSHAQDSIPSDLRGEFDSTNTQLQISFTGDASEGLPDGSTVRASDCAEVPDFSLGDSSGVNTNARFIIMMLDTTCDRRIVHYIRSGFQPSGFKTQISSDSSAEVPYTAPGELNEKGTRQYSFLMFGQRRNAQLQDFPAAGDEIDVEAFIAANSNIIRNTGAIAGTGIEVALGGNAGCNGNNGGAQPTEDIPESTEAPISTPQETVVETPTITTRRTLAVPTTRPIETPAETTSVESIVSSEEQVETELPSITRSIPVVVAPQPTDDGAATTTEVEGPIFTDPDASTLVEGPTRVVPTTTLVTTIAPDVSGEPNASATEPAEVSTAGGVMVYGGGNGAVVAVLGAIAGLIAI